MILETDVAVIGNGFSATALAVHLIDTLPPQATVTLVGSRTNRARGIAYSTGQARHRLNVPAGRMSLFDDQPGDFVAWLAEQGLRHGADSFVPRGLYGRYLGDRLDAACRRTGNRAALSFVDATALTAEAVCDGGHLFGLSDGRKLKARFSALCIGASGAPLPRAGVALDPAARDRIVEDPWSEDWQQRLAAEGNVLFVGTGLTMVDQCLTLKELGFAGRMWAISRRGLLPQAHVAPRAVPVEPPFAPGECGIVEMLARLRKAARAAGSWQGAVDGLRPVTQAIWQAMEPAERSRFLRHAASFWNAHRHRMAPEVGAEIQALLTSGTLAVGRGRLRRLAAREGGLDVTVATARSGALRTFRVDLVVNCTGLDRCALSRSPLFADMAESGMICCDPFGLGIVTDEHAAVIPASGRVSGRLYAVGAATAGRFWEITAVPDIRVQAKDVATAIGKQVRMIACRPKGDRGICAPFTLLS